VDLPGEREYLGKVERNPGTENVMDQTAERKTFDGEPNVPTCRRLEKYALDVFNFRWQVTYDGTNYGVVKELGQVLPEFVVLGRTYSIARTKIHIIAEDIPDADQPAFVKKPEPVKKEQTDLERRDEAMAMYRRRLQEAYDNLMGLGGVEADDETWDPLKPGRWIHYALGDIQPLVEKAEREVSRRLSWKQMREDHEKRQAANPLPRPSAVIRESRAQVVLMPGEEAPAGSAETFVRVQDTVAGRGQEPTPAEEADASAADVKARRKAARSVVEEAVLAALSGVSQPLTVPQILDAVLKGVGILREIPRRDAHYDTWTACQRLEKRGAVIIAHQRGGARISVPSKG
jgi:hypothetical protein